MKNAQPPFASSVPPGIWKPNIVTPKIKVETPSGPLALVEADLPFLLPSSTMFRANGLTTSPLDFSDQEWPLSRNTTDPTLALTLTLTVCQVSSLPPSMIKNIDILILLLINFELINWWPRHYCQQPRDIISLSQDDLIDAINCMIQYEDSLKRQKPQTSKHPPNHPHNHLHSKTTVNIPFFNVSSSNASPYHFICESPLLPYKVNSDGTCQHVANADDADNNTAPYVATAKATHNDMHNESISVHLPPKCTYLSILI